MRSACHYCCSTPRSFGYSGYIRGNNCRLLQNETSLYEEVYEEVYEEEPTEEESTEEEPVVYEAQIGSEKEGVTFASQHDGPTKGSRRLSLDNVQYSPYRWLELLHTEFYFRYKGRFTAPPCAASNAWRVLKDPLLVHPDQVAELERLLADRRAPLGSGSKSCQLDNAGKARPGSGGTAFDFNRPLQSVTMEHDMQFCQCIWKSKFAEDLAWCELPLENRLSNLNLGSHNPIYI